MKFEQIKDLKVPKNKYSQKEIKKNKVSNNIKSIKRYNNLAIFLMNPNTKGSLRTLTCNDGIKNCSWICRITFKNNEWSIDIVPFNDVDKNNININLFEIINDKFQNIENTSITGNLHVCFIKTINKKNVEDIINHCIEKISDNEIMGIKKFPINKSFTIKNHEDEYKLIYSYQSKNKYNKEKALLKLIEKRIEDKTIIDDLKNKDILSQDDIETINSLSISHCSEKERLQIAIKFMS